MWSNPESHPSGDKVGGGEEKPQYHQREKSILDEEMDRDIGQLNCPPLRNGAILDNELITNDLDRLKIREGEESDTD